MRVIFLGCGYLGYNLSRLVKNDFDVSVFGIPSPYTGLIDDLTEVDVFDPEAMRKTDVKDAVVIDSTGLVANNAVSDDEEKMLADLREKYRALLAVLKENGAARFIYISSGGTIYGSGKKAFTEEDPVQPVSLYAKSKDVTERAVRESGLDWVIMRLANPYGGYQEPNKRQGVIPILIRKAFRSEVFQMWTDGSSVRDYIYITDTAKALRLLIKKGVNNEIVNIGSGEGTSLKDVVKEVEEHTGRKIRMEYQVPDVPVVEAIVLDITKLKTLTGYEADVPFDEGVRLETERIRKEIC